MSCYKDRTFCPPEIYEKCLNADTCSAKLTPKIIADAATFGLPTSEFTGRPECFVGDEEDNNRRKEEESL